MRNQPYAGRLFLTILLLSSLGVIPVQADSSHGKGGKDRGASSAGKEARGPKSPKTEKSPKTVEALLAQNTGLSTKLQELLPPETDLLLAAAGFKNLGQFVAALHVSYNLGIPFDQLKTATVDNGQSLGQAVRFLRPADDTEEEVEEAENVAEEEVM